MRRILLSFAAVALLSFVPGLARAQPVVVPGVRVSIAPPPLRAEVRPRAPSAAHVWIPGHWAWRGGAHVWMAGRYALPPAAGYRWVPARWVSERGQWVFFEGHWAVSQPPSAGSVYDPGPAPTEEEVVQVAPPAPIVEVRPPLPFAGAVWIPGYWRWHDGRHVWVGGRWSAARAGSVWEPNHWQHTPRGWVHVHGHWRRG
jgi:hypothetical protein